jgi:hypothetical protein
MFVIVILCSNGMDSNSFMEITILLTTGTGVISFNFIPTDILQMRELFCSNLQSIKGVLSASDFCTRFFCVLPLL